MLNKLVVSGKKFITNTQVFIQVVWLNAVNGLQWCQNFLNRYMLQLLKWLFTIPLIFMWFKIPSNWSLFDKRVVSRNIFKPITLVFDLVDMTKICVKLLATFVWTFKITVLRIYALQLLKWLCTIPSVLFWFINPSNQGIYNTRMVPGKNFKVIASVLYAVDMTK